MNEFFRPANPVTSRFPNATIINHAEILAKNAHMKIKNDPNMEMFPWNNQDCRLEINPESEWGKILLDLKLDPKLICHVPDLKFELSEPFDQV